MSQKYTFSALCLVASAVQATPTPSPREPARLIGVVNGFKDIRRDDQLDGAILIPSLRAEKLLALRFDEFLSPNEKVSAGPRTVDVPGNIYLPQQSEKYGIITINIEKSTFTVYPQPGITNEMAALSFQAQFSKVVKLGKSNAPVTALLPFVKIGNMGFASDRDWSVYHQPVGFNLSSTPSHTLSYRWTRDAAPQGSQDTIVNFQKTPASRWLPTDFKGAPAPTGTLNTYANFANETKTAFVRLFNSTDPSETAPTAGVGWIRNQSATGVIDVQSLPLPLTGLSVTDTAVTWTPIERPGWVAVIRSEARAGARKENPLRGISIGLADFAPNKPHEEPRGEFLGWARSSEGQLALNAPVGNDHVSVVFIGTDREVPAPQAGVDGDPELFTHATELRFARVK